MNSLVFEVSVYFCEAVIFGSLYINLLRPGIRIPYILLLWIEAVLLGMALTPSFSLSRIVLITLLEGAVILFSFEDKLPAKLGRFLLVEAASGISALIAYLLSALFANQRAPFMEICSGENATYILLYLTVLSIMASMLFQYAKKVKRVELPWVSGTQLVLGAGECIAVLTYSALHKGMIQRGGSFWFFIAVGCFVAANLSVGILASFLIRRFTFHQSIDFGKELSNMEYKYYEMSLENDKKIQSLRHEIANQIQTVYSLLLNGESEKSLELMNELRDQYEQMDQLIYCENPVLNIILANKKAEAEKAGIEIQIKVKDYPKQLPVSDFDLSTVVCNLVDNAIRGCLCSNQSHPRLIIEIIRKNSYLVIRVLNTCAVNMVIENTDRIETTKSNSQTHGFGMPIIAGIVKRYKGDFLVSAQNGLFTATAIMSVK